MLLTSTATRDVGHLAWRSRQIMTEYRSRVSRGARRARLAVAIGTLIAGRASAATSPEPRELPDYDGRGGQPTTPGKVLLWVPRIAFFPFYLVSEYVVRRPLGWLITSAEHAN